MAFNPQGTDYRCAQASRDRADEGLTRALDRKGRADKQARIKKSGERSGLQKLVSAGARGLAAVYTGGLSETMGAGSIIDSAMLGTDSEGNAVRNEYGDLVGAGAAVYRGGMAQKDAKLAKQDAKFDKLRNKRMDIVNTMFDAGMKTEGMNALKAIENMETDYAGKRKGMEGGWNPFAHSDEDYNALQPTGMNRAQREARETQLNQGASGQTDQGTNVVGPPSVLSPPSVQRAQTQTQSPHQESSNQSGGGLPPPASAQKAPSLADMELRALEKKKADREQLKGMSDKELNQRRMANSWFSNMDDAKDIVPSWEDRRQQRGPQ